MGEGRRVLIIDDDPAFVASTTLVLEQNGYVVDSAPDGDEGLEKAQGDKPDMVLLDVMMNWPLEGVQVSREMLSKSGLRGIPIIMVTSILDTEYRATFPQDEYLHIDGWLNKPVSPSKLIDEVQRIFSHYEKLREQPET